MHNPPVAIANLVVKYDTKATPPCYVWSTIKTRNVRDENGVFRVFELLATPGSKTWVRGNVSLAHQLNMAGGGSTEARIWYDPATMSTAQARKALVDLVAANLRKQIDDRTQQLTGLLTQVG